MYVMQSAKQTIETEKELENKVNNNLFNDKNNLSQLTFDSFPLKVVLFYFVLTPI